MNRGIVECARNLLKNKYIDGSSFINRGSITFSHVDETHVYIYYYDSESSQDIFLGRVTKEDIVIYFHNHRLEFKSDGSILGHSTSPSYVGPIFYLKPNIQKIILKTIL